MEKVKFGVSTRYVGSRSEEIFTLEALGIDEKLEGEEMEKALFEAYQEWLWEEIDIDYGIIE